MIRWRFRGPRCRGLGGGSVLKESRGRLCSVGVSRLRDLVREWVRV